jgi:chromosomal replication initiator protein
VPTRRQTRIAAEAVLRLSANFYAVTPDALRGPGQARPLTEARGIALYVARRLTAASYPELGAVFGGRDHSTVRSAILRVSARVAVDVDVADEAGDLERLCREHLDAARARQYPLDLPVV